jgi:hypothetical protein
MANCVAVSTINSVAAINRKKTGERAGRFADATRLK